MGALLQPNECRQASDHQGAVAKGAIPLRAGDQTGCADPGQPRRDKAAEQPQDQPSGSGRQVEQDTRTQTGDDQQEQLLSRPMGGHWR